MYSDGIKLDLTQEEVKEAIALGKQGKESLQDLLKPYLFRGEQTIYRDYKDGGHVVTKFVELAALSCELARKYKSPTQEDIDEILKNQTLTILVNTFGSAKDFTRDYHVVLKQGDKVIQPAGIVRKEAKTPYPPESDYPSMEATLFTRFPYSEIDLKGKATIALIKERGEFPFEVDFSQCK